MDNKNAQGLLQSGGIHSNSQKSDVDLLKFTTTGNIKKISCTFNSFCFYHLLPSSLRSLSISLSISFVFLGKYGLDDSVDDGR